MMQENIKGVTSHHSNSLTDNELWSFLRQGQKTAFDELFIRHYRELFRYASKMCATDIAEDCVQSVFIKLWESRDNLHEVKAVKSYLWRMVRNAIVTDYRKHNRRAKLLDFMRSDLAPGMRLHIEDLIIEEEVGEECRRQLKKAIRSLSARQREVIYLKYYDGMSYQEIEQIMDVNYQTVRNYTCDAIKILKECMQFVPCKF